MRSSPTFHPRSAGAVGRHLASSIPGRLPGGKTFAAPPGHTTMQPPDLPPLADVILRLAFAGRLLTRSRSY